MPLELKYLKREIIKQWVSQSPCLTFALWWDPENSFLLARVCEDSHSIYRKHKVSGSHTSVIMQSFILGRWWRSLLNSIIAGVLITTTTTTINPVVQDHVWAWTHSLRNNGVWLMTRACVLSQHETHLSSESIRPPQPYNITLPWQPHATLSQPLWVGSGNMTPPDHSVSCFGLSGLHLVLRVTINEIIFIESLCWLPLMHAQLSSAQINLTWRALLTVFVLLLSLV